MDGGRIHDLQSPFCMRQIMGCSSPLLGHEYISSSISIETSTFGDVQNRNLHKCNTDTHDLH